MDGLSGVSPSGQRKLSRAARRVQLIEATIEALAERGYARTTLSDVARTAGLSHGLVNFHFESKELLFSETLAYLAEGYRAHWQAALGSAGPGPAQRLEALIRADFAPDFVTRTRLGAWVAFWGEAQGRPFYQDNCCSRGNDHAQVWGQSCADLMREAGYQGAPERVARALRQVSEGVWKDLAIAAAPYSREEGLATVFAAAAAFFPRHFTETGLQS